MDKVARNTKDNSRVINSVKDKIPNFIEDSYDKFYINEAITIIQNFQY